MKKYFICYVLLLIIPSVVYAKTYTIVTIAYSGLEPYVVAVEKNFFKAEGIDVDRRHYTSMVDWWNAITSGRFDFNPAWVSTHMGICLDMKKFVMPGVTGNEGSGTTAIIIKKEADGGGIKGHVIGASAETLGVQYVILTYLKQFDLSLSDVKLVYLTDDDLASNYIVNRIQGVYIEGSYIDRLSRDGKGIVWRMPDNIIPPSMITPAVPADRFGQMPEKDLKKFWRAIIAASEWINDFANKREYREILQKSFKGNDAIEALLKTEAGFEKFYKMEINYTKKEMINQNKHSIKELFNGALEVRAQIGKSQDLVYDEVVDTTALMKVLSE